VANPCQISLVTRCYENQQAVAGGAASRTPASYASHTAHVDGTLAWPLEHAARTGPDATAVVDGDRRLTYRELRRRVGGLGTALADFGLQQGTVVAVLAGNTLANLECWHALPANGFVMNALNYRLATPELAFMVDDSQASVLLVDRQRLDIGRELRDRCDSLRQLVYMDEDEAPADCLAYEELVTAEQAPAPELPSEALAAISYTGGTTGRPKGVMLSHRNLLANAKHNTMEAGFRPTDRYLHSAPMFHVADISQLYGITWAGGTHVMMHRFDAREVVDAVPRYGLTFLIFVPTMLRLFLEELRERPVDVSTLRTIIYAAAPISVELQRWAMEALPCTVLQGYGMTEAAPSLCFLTADDHRRGASGEEPYVARLGSVGRQARGVQVEIRDPDDRPLPAGEIGEICARGPNIMLGYWNRPEETAAALRDGWYHTGDAGYADEDGYVYLVDRLKDMIVTGGENVYSIEVERALLQHPAVSEAAVFAIPHERWGEAVHAAVTLTDGTHIDEAELVDHCRMLIAGYKLPRSLELRREPLPKSGAGKILKHELRAPYWAGRDRHVAGS